MRQIMTAVALFLIGCAASPPLPQLEVPMVESWRANPQLLVLEIPRPDPHMEADEHPLFLRVSLLHRPYELRLPPMGESLFEPILPGAVLTVRWQRVVQSAVYLNVTRFLVEGLVGIAPIEENGHMLRIIACPDELLTAGYLERPGSRTVVLLASEPEWHTDPEYGCLYRLSMRP